MTPIEMAEHIESLSLSALRFPEHREAYVRDIRQTAKELAKSLKKEQGGKSK